MDVAIKDEWLDVFRSGREVMRAASAALQRTIVTTAKAPKP